jgi:hypothetical protein
MSKYKIISALYILLLSSPFVVQAGESLPPSECTYQMQVWNVYKKDKTSMQVIRHPYFNVTAEETDQTTGCTVCSEDQELINIAPIKPFSVCYKIAPQIRFAISNLIKKGEPIFSIVGYHVIKSRGRIDGKGNRTEFSNHSFGSAIDINPAQNGLYDKCIEFGPQCRLLRGGAWRIGELGTLEKEGTIVKSLKTAGFQWGGEISGNQKDFMHFSQTGY